jgi:tetratricopeptide (TPR) repeat protein
VLGESATPPEGLSQILQSGDLQTRFDALEATADLPNKQPKPAQVTSREKAKEATDLPDKTAPDMDAGGKSATGPVSNGQLRFLGEESVRIQIDGGPSQAVPSTSISVAPGQHRISYAYGEQNVIVSAGQAITVSIPTTYAEQLLHDGVEAYQEKRLDRAQQCLERVRLLQDRGLVQRNLLPDLALSLARLYEAQNNLKRALQEYNRLSGMVDAQHRPELRRVVDRAMARLSPNVGHVVLFRKDPAGKCIKTDQYLPPGDHVLYSGWNIDLVDDAAGKVGVVRVKAGATVTVNKCR